MTGGFMAAGDLQGLLLPLLAVVTHLGAGRSATNDLEEGQEQ